MCVWVQNQKYQCGNSTSIDSYVLCVCVCVCAGAERDCVVQYLTCCGVCGYAGMLWLRGTVWCSIYINLLWCVCVYAVAERDCVVSDDDLLCVALGGVKTTLIYTRPLIISTFSFPFLGKGNYFDC